MKKQIIFVVLMTAAALACVHGQVGFTDSIGVAAGYDTQEVDGFPLNSSLDYLIGVEPALTDFAILANARASVFNFKNLSLGLQFDWYLSNFFGIALAGGAQFPDLDFGDPVPYGRASAYASVFSAIKAGLEFEYRMDKTWGIALNISLPLFSWPAKLHKTHFNYRTSDKRLVGKWVYEDERDTSLKYIYEFYANHRLNYSVLYDNEVFSTRPGTYSTFSDSALAIYWTDTKESGSFNYTARNDGTLSITTLDPLLLMAEIDPERAEQFARIRDDMEDIAEIEGKAPSKPERKVYVYKLQQ